MGNYAFYSCSSLTNINFPSCTIISMYTFARCSALTAVNFPACTSIKSNAFSNCTSLTTASFPICSRIEANAFVYCSALNSIYLLNSSRIILSSTDVFIGTPMLNSTYLGHFGSIYVPSSLLTQYKTATNWSYYSARIVGI